MNRLLLGLDGDTTGIHVHKFFAPTVSANSVLRTALLDQVFHDDAAPVVFLQGPAGHGKSTVLQQIKSRCDAEGIFTGWLTFDDADNDTRRFSNHLQALVASLNSRNEIPRIEDGESKDVARFFHCVDGFIDSLLSIDHPVALFFDEFQALTDTSILSFWRDVLARTPHNARIFIGCRSLPEVGLARLVVENRAQVLRADELRFSSSEVHQFFELFRVLEVSNSEIEAIYNRTEGWPAAVQLFRLSLMSPSIRRSLGNVATYRPRELAEYLIESVLSLQTSTMRDFLLRTSILSRLTAPLCDLVTGRTDSRDVLIGLERSGLFLRSLDSDLRWFKYHGLFASCLTDQLRSIDRQVVVDVHRTAANWYKANGLYEETIHHAIECEDFSLAADTLDDYSSALIPSAHVITVDRWASRLPIGEILKRPPLAIKVAWARAFMRGPRKLEKVLELLSNQYGENQKNSPGAEIIVSIAAMCADDIPRAFAGICAVEVGQTAAEGFSAFELAAAANMHAYRALTIGELELSHHYLNIAKAYNQSSGASFSGGYTACFEGVTLLLQGHLQRALICLQRGLEEQSALFDKSFVTAALVACYIWARYEANDLDVAELVFNEYREMLIECAVPDFLSVGHLSAARICLARGRRDAAMEILAEAERIAIGNNWIRMANTVRWERARQGFFLESRQQEHLFDVRSNSVDEERLPDVWIPFSEMQEGEALGTIRKALTRRNFDTCATLIERELARCGERLYLQARLHVLDALLQDARGNRTSARRSLRKALQIAMPDRYVRLFLDEGEAAITLVREEFKSYKTGGENPHSSNTSSDFLEAILQNQRDLEKTTSSQTDEGIYALTDREREILCFLSEGVSNREMAAKMFLSENTIKYHLKNIFQKLSVSSRIQAIALAQQAGLLVR
ncbi:MAG: LuxR C-terminal-related transcriptional regulator [Rhodocyclaceae bacterium]|nr:LuxR C-terminal-related transcriptional regulator [Rhodocyclaceae bacterium]